MIGYTPVRVDPLILDCDETFEVTKNQSAGVGYQIVALRKPFLN